MQWQGGWVTLPLRFSEDRVASSIWGGVSNLIVMGGGGETAETAERTSEKVSTDGAYTRRSFRMRYAIE